MSDTPNNPDNGSTNSDSGSSRYGGFAIAASFSLLAILLWIAPTYVGFSGWIAWACYVVGAVCVSISFFGALSELGDLLKIEAFSTFGVGLFFLLPAVLLHLVVSYTSISSDVLIQVLKVCALLLTAFGGFLALYSIAEVFDAIEKRRAVPSDQRAASSGGVFLTVLSFLSAALPIVGFVVNAAIGFVGN